MDTKQEEKFQALLRVGLSGSAERLMYEYVKTGVWGLSDFRRGLVLLERARRIGFAVDTGRNGK